MTEVTEKRPHWARRVLLALLVVVIVAGVALAIGVWHRLEQRRLGEGVVQPPSEFAAARCLRCAAHALACAKGFVPPVPAQCKQAG